MCSYVNKYIPKTRLILLEFCTCGFPGIGSSVQGPRAGEDLHYTVISVLKNPPIINKSMLLGLLFSGSGKAH